MITWLNIKYATWRPHYTPKFYWSWWQRITWRGVKKNYRLYTIIYSSDENCFNNFVSYNWNSGESRSKHNGCKMMLPKRNCSCCSECTFYLVSKQRTHVETGQIGSKQSVSYAVKIILGRYNSCQTNIPIQE